MTHLAAELKKILDRPVVLVGMMGSGKSHVGRRLAQGLELPFYDSDALVEEKAGLSVAEIFETHGEAKFRESEQRTILGLLESGPCVIATGGGAVTAPETLAALKSKTHMVWLRVGIEEILARIGQATDRPLLRADDPRAVLAGLLAQREPLYGQAAVSVDSIPGTVAETAESVIKSLYARLNTDKF